MKPHFGEQCSDTTICHLPRIPPNKHPSPSHRERGWHPVNRAEDSLNQGGSLNFLQKAGGVSQEGNITLLLPTAINHTSIQTTGGHN